MPLRIAICVVLLILLGCARLPLDAHEQDTTADDRESIETALSAEELSRRWLQKVPCAAPCWEGIVPGITTVQEARRILSEPPLHFDIEAEGYSSPLSLYWIGSDYLYGEVIFDPKVQTPKVTELLVSLTRPFAISEVFAVYGEPDYLVIHSGTAEEDTDIVFYSVSYVYPSHGLTFNVSGTVAPLSPGGETNWIVFFQPPPEGVDSLSYLSESMSGPGAQLVPWDGFKPFREYCVEAFPADYDWWCPSED